MSVDVALAAAVGAAIGGVAGFVAAILQLQVKRLRNGLRVRAGKAPYRDLVLVRWHVPSLVVGLVLGAGLALVLPWTQSALVGGLALPALVALTLPLVVILGLRAP